MGVLVLLGFAWLVNIYGRPVTFALVYAGITLGFSLLSSDLTASVISGLTNLLFAAIYFALIERYAGNLLAYLATLFCGALAWFLLPIWLLAQS